MTDTHLICSLTAPSLESLAEKIIQARAAGAQVVELRLDGLDDAPTPEALCELLKGSLPAIITFRPMRQGGYYEGDEAARLALLKAACEMPNVLAVDIEDDVPVEDRPQTGCRILSYHNFEECPDAGAKIAEMDVAPEQINKIAFASERPEHALLAMEYLREAKKPTMLMAMGFDGLASRILAKKFGAYGTYTALSNGAELAPGQPTLEGSRRLYRWGAIKPTTRLFGVIGCPVAHSMSPAIHNAAFDATGYDGLYFPFCVQPDEAEFNFFLDGLQSRPWLDWRGLSVTIPHKANALNYVGEENCCELSIQIGAVNTITRQSDGSLLGTNTDYAAALNALCDALRIDWEGLNGRSVAILGAGGVARAVLAGLTHCRAEVTVYNRTLKRAESLAGEFAARAEPLENAQATEAEIVINCTALGMHPNIETTPLEAIPEAAKVVFDTVYNPLETRLLKEAAAAGCVCVNGLTMFVNQAVAQFETWTELPAPREVMQNVVEDRLRQG